MNHHRFEDMRVGMTESFSVTVTADMMDKFYQITGDDSPIHMSDEAAQARGHKGRVVYGMLGGSLFSTLAGVHLPGAHCLLHSVELTFAKPVYLGDTLTVTGTVKEINDTFRTVTVKAEIKNQNGVKVTRGAYQCGVE